MTGYLHHARCRCAALAWIAPLAGVAAVIGPATAAMGQLPTGVHTDCATLIIADGVPVLTIDQHTPDCVIDWDSFNIGAGFTVGFLQQSSSWRALGTGVVASTCSAKGCPRRTPTISCTATPSTWTPAESGS